MPAMTATASGRGESALERLSHHLHEKLIWLLILSYFVAAFFPAFGLKLRGVGFGTLTLFGESTRVSLPMIMLALLLFNAGLGVQTTQLRGLARHPLPLAGGLLANLAVPIAFIFAVSQLMRFWHNSDEVQNILLGLAIVISMPIAGSSTAWAQNANGDLALSLGLVLFSTFLSPITTPVALHAVGWMASGDHAATLFGLASYGTDLFLAICVIVPSLGGILVRVLLGDKRIERMKSKIKLINSLNLLLLCYSNASISLPQAVAKPDIDFLVVTCAVVASLCVFAFAMGWTLARSLRLGREPQISLMFGLGMNNNGTGLVLASMTLAGYPQVMLPIIFYNLVQHLVAGIVALTLFRIPRVSTQAASPSPPCRTEANSHS